MYAGAGRSSVAEANSDCALLDRPDLVQHDLVRSKHEQYRFRFRKTDRVW
jgi:hypothetical protein